MCYSPNFDALCPTAGFPVSDSNFGASIAFSKGVLFAGMPRCCSGENSTTTGGAWQLLIQFRLLLGFHRPCSKVLLASAHRNRVV